MLNNVQFETIKFNVKNAFIPNNNHSAEENELNQALYNDIVDVAIKVLKEYDKLQH